MTELKRGDKVYLVSGGPIMAFDGDEDMRGGCLCAWFVENELKEAYIRKELLMKVPEDGNAGPKSFWEAADPDEK
ncbi:MAG: hypothetical protein ABFD98_15905 [Syntrophobacteraceae bacterium]